MPNANGFTETQQRILELLSDGKPHRRMELKAQLPDELSSLTAMQMHVSVMRKVLNPKGEDIVCRFTKEGISYQHIRLLSNPYTGYK
jgi:hypothetical protein